MVDLPKIIISLLFIAGLIFVAFYVDFSAKKDSSPKAEEKRRKKMFSKKLSIAFYVLIGLLILFFGLMYIKYRMIYG